MKYHTPIQYTQEPAAGVREETANSRPQRRLGRQSGRVFDRPWLACAGWLAVYFTICTDCAIHSIGSDRELAISIERARGGRGGVSNLS